MRFEEVTRRSREYATSITPKRYSMPLASMVPVPAKQVGVCKPHPTLGNHLDEVSVAQLVAHLPSSEEDNDLAVEVPRL